MACEALSHTLLLEIGYPHLLLCVTFVLLVSSSFQKVGCDRHVLLGETTPILYSRLLRFVDLSKGCFCDPVHWRYSEGKFKGVAIIGRTLVNVFLFNLIQVGICLLGSGLIVSS